MIASGELSVFFLKEMHRKICKGIEEDELCIISSCIYYMNNRQEADV